MNNDLTQTGLTLLAGLLAVGVFMSMALLIAVRRQMLVIVDTAWGLGFVVIAAASVMVSLGGDGDAVVPWVPDATKGLTHPAL